MARKTLQVHERKTNTSKPPKACINVAQLHARNRPSAGVNKPDVVKYISRIQVHIYMCNIFYTKFISCTSQTECAGPPCPQLLGHLAKYQ